MKILVDNGHGCDTLGKCSPDGKFKEFSYCREIADIIVANLQRFGYDADILTPEKYDVPLTERCRRVNEACEKYGKENVVLVSVHNNAAGSDGKWHEASGWSQYLHPKASTRSKKLAQSFSEFVNSSVYKEKLKGNRVTPPGGYNTANFKILRDTKCAAVLTENMFQDNRGDVEWLTTEEGKNTIAQLHVDALSTYADKPYSPFDIK